MGLRNEILFPKKPYKKRPRQDFGVLDIETDGLGGQFIYGATYYPEDGIRFHDTMLDLVKYVSQHLGTEWYAHNGAKYDYLYMLENGSDSKAYLLENFNVSILSTKASTIGLVLHPSEFDTATKRVRKYDIKLKDFYRIVPFSLQKVTDKFCTQYKKLGGTIDWNKEKFDKTNETHIQYLINDILSLYEAITVFSGIVFDIFGIKLGWTTPGMAMDAWQRSMTSTFKRLPEDLRKFIRNTYHGGMVQVRHTHKPDIFHGIKANDLTIKAYDVNSMYPAQMLKGVPTGTPIEIFEYVEKPAFYHANITIPDTIFPFIAVQEKWGTLYPTGTFDAYLTSVELELLLEHGGTLNQIYKGYAFDKTEPIFDAFINKCMTVRIKNKDTILEIVAKLFQNALYGKFGSREEIQSLELAIFPSSEDALAYIDEKTGEPIAGLWLTEKKLDVPYLHPEWASWITASARVTLAKAIIALDDTFIYCDTDSIKFFDIGQTIDIEISDTKYGAWKSEGEFDDVVVVAPKTYGLHMGIDERTRIAIKEGKTTDEIPEWIIHTKGVPNKRVTPDNLVQALQGNETPIPMGVMKGMAPMLKQGSNISYREITRNITKPTNVKGFQFIDGQFLPWNFERYLAVQHA